MARSELTGGAAHLSHHCLVSLRLRVQPAHGRTAWGARVGGVLAVASRSVPSEVAPSRKCFATDRGSPVYSGFFKRRKQVWADLRALGRLGAWGRLAVLRIRVCRYHQGHVAQLQAGFTGLGIALEGMEETVVQRTALELRVAGPHGKPIVRTGGKGYRACAGAYRAHRDGMIWNMRPLSPLHDHR